MNNLTKFTVSVFFLFTSSVFANSTTSDIKGSVVDGSGDGLSGAEVTVTYEATNTTKTVIADADGNFYAANLKPGGPYTVASGNSKISDVYLTLGKTTNISLTLISSASIEEVVVTAARENTVETTSGPSYVFSSADLANAASYDRDIKEVLAKHPTIYINDADNKAMQCAGNNPRLNALTVDGMPMNDTFGLNSNGYPAERMPFSYDALDQVAVEFAPYDVKYGGFSACIVNAVTKSGTSELTGSFFYEITNDDLTGDEAGGNPIIIPGYDEAKYGFSVGGPVLQDQLVTGEMFFFVSYEQYDDQDLGEFGYAGSGMPSELSWLSKSMYDEIVEISNTVYNFDPGGLPSALDSESEKLLAKIDYYVNDNTRAVFTYNSSKGFSNVPSDASPSEFEFSNHFYKRGNDLDSYMLQVFSSIGNVNTQFKYGHQELDNTQVGLGGAFGDFQIIVDAADNTVYLGGTDDSRQNNKLNYSSTNLAFIGDVQLGNQVITFGYENVENTMFNLFIQESIGGEWDFASIDDFRNGNAYVHFQGTSSMDPNDAAKEWTYDISSLFVQSEMSVSDALDVTYGIRYDKYGVSEGPRPNAAFEAANGYSNSITFDGAEVIMPRISFSYRPNDITEVYGGYGVFSGGNPAVWFSNAYSNDGVSISGGDGMRDALNDDMCNPLTGALSDGSILQGPGYFVPCAALDRIQNANAGGSVNALSENFEMPTYKKLSLGVKTTVGEYDVTLDWMVARNKNPLYTYWQRDFTEYATSGHALYSGSGDYILANDDDAPRTSVISLIASRSFDNDIDVTFGYTNTNAQDVHPMASSTAFTNARENAVSMDHLDPVPGRSDWEIEHRFVTSVDWLVSDKTKIGLFHQIASGNPYSLGVTGNGFWDPLNPLYIGENAVYEESATALMNMEPGLYERNSETSDWSSRVDLKITHTPMENLDLYMVVKNLGNLLNGEFGDYRRSSTLNKVASADWFTYATDDNGTPNDITDDFDYVTGTTGKVTYSGYKSPNTDQLISTASIWNVKLGFNYSF